MISLAKRVAWISLFAVILWPIVMYVVGTQLAGPYAGSNGLGGLIGHFFIDMMRGEATAWTLVVAPAAVYLTWKGVIGLLRINNEKHGNSSGTS